MADGQHGAGKRALLDGIAQKFENFAEFHEVTIETGMV